MKLDEQKVCRSVTLPNKNLLQSVHVAQGMGNIVGHSHAFRPERMGLLSLKYFLHSSTLLLLPFLEPKGHDIIQSIQDNKESRREGIFVVHGSHFDNIGVTNHTQEAGFHRQVDDRTDERLRLKFDSESAISCL